MTLYCLLIALSVEYVSGDMILGTLNVALGATKFTSHGPQRYLLYNHRDVFDNLYDTANFIDKYDIDIIALQELDVNTNRIKVNTESNPNVPDQDIRVDDPQEIDDILYENFNREYIARWMPVINWGPGTYGNSIIFNEKKFNDPLQNKIQRHLFDAKHSETRGAIATKFLWSNYQLWFVSTHFSYDAPTAKLQLAELMSIVSTFSYPTVICGDFNLDHNDNEYKSFLDDTFSSNGFKSIIDPNNVGTYPKDNNYKKIDYCLYKDVGNTGWFSVSNAQYIAPINDNDEYFTDHWGLIFTLQFNSQYREIQSFGGKCLDIHRTDYDDKKNGGLVQIWDCNTWSNQQWNINENNEIKSKNGQCLDVHNEDYWDNINGAKLQIWDCNGWENQKWFIEDNQIKSANGKCLDVYIDELSNNGGRVQLWDCDNNNKPTNQQWSF